MAISSSLVGAILSGLAFGMVLFIASVGLTLIFGVMKVINFAHGSFYMFGAFFMFSLFADGGMLGGQFWISAILAALMVGLVGGILEITLIRPLYEQNYVYQFLITFALVLVLDNLARIIWDSQFRSVPLPEALNYQVEVLGASFPAYNIFLIVFGGAIGLALWVVFTYTQFGKLVKVTAEDKETASTTGINVPYLYTIVFIIGAILAGLAGALSAPIRTIHPNMGADVIIDIFIVIIIGGMGSFIGALVGSLLIGLLRSLLFLYVPGLGPVIPYLVLIAVLLASPTGLFGEEHSLE